MKRSTWLVLALAMIWTVAAIYFYAGNPPGPMVAGDLRYPLSRIQLGTNRVSLEPLGITDWTTAVYRDNEVAASPLRHLFLVKFSDDDIRIFGGVDPDLGCNIVWEESDQQFMNPCHAQRYNQEGIKLSGPGGHDRMPVLSGQIAGTDLLIFASRFVPESGLEP